MTTRTTVTSHTAKARRLIQPLMRPAKTKDSKKLTLSDAEVVVLWLNGPKGAERDRVLGFRKELGAISSGFAHLLETHATSPAWIALKTKAPSSPDPDWTAKYRAELEQLQKRTDTLNKRLSCYAFHPGIGATVITETRNGGLVPDADKRSLKLRVGEFELVEADAALALVRLYLVGELHRVQLCEMCKKDWRVKAKSHYRFCSGECRESYYAKSPDYNERKAKSQARYRQRLKKYLNEFK
jgi:hypothetical protein